MLLNAELRIFRKQLGAVFRDERDFELIVKEKHEEDFKTIQVTPEHPNFELPSLAELSNADDYPQHNEIRWKFLKWAVNSPENREIERIPQKFFTDILILNFLRREGFLEVPEADLILLSIKMAQEGNYERSLDEIPECLNAKAFKISFLFRKFFEPVDRCIKMAGLKEFKVSFRLGFRIKHFFIFPNFFIQLSFLFNPTEAH